MSEDRLRALEEGLAELRGALLGMDGVGGIVRRLEQVAARHHQLANVLTEVQTTLQLQEEELRVLVSELTGRDRT